MTLALQAADVPSAPASGSVPASRYVLGTRVDATSYEDATERIISWALANESRYVCVSNVHMVMEAYDDPSFREVVVGADLVTPDGMPLVWALRLLGVPEATRTYGPKLTPLVCARAAREGIRVGFFGGMPHVLDALVARLRQRFPRLDVAYAASPPFRRMTRAEDEDVVSAIDASGARILFVGLGCPKQEQWMASHRGSVRTVMIGVGAAFDFLAGVKRQAPPLMQCSGLEWLFRLLQEPRRLWRRYLYHNPRYIGLLAMQLFGSKGIDRRVR